MALHNLALGGVSFEPEDVRVHPLGESARHVVGNVDTGGVGLSAAERAFNDEIRAAGARGESFQISIDLRALDGKVLKKMLRDAQRASERAAKKNQVTVTWSPLLHITPRPFDETLMKLVRASVKEVAGSAPELPSGPLHDASEMAGVVPTAMVFAQSSPGISHTRIEDTPRPALDQSIRAFLRTVDRTLEHHARV